MLQLQEPTPKLVSTVTTNPLTQTSGKNAGEPEAELGDEDNNTPLPNVVTECPELAPAPPIESPFPPKDINIILDILNNIEIEEEHTRAYDANGIIDQTSCQGKIGDCWLLSGVHALSQTELGAKAIQDAIEFQDNGDVVVTFKGANRSYTLTEDEVLDAMRTNEYVEGDGDMLILELATEKLYNDFAKANFSFTDSGLKYDIGETNETIHNDMLKYKSKGEKSIEGGFSAQLMYFLTGKEIDYDYYKKEKMESLEEFKDGNIALVCDFKPYRDKSYAVMQDINGDTIKLACEHAYSISEVNEDSVTIINPWDTSEEITLPIDSFIKRTFYLDKCNLNSEDINYLEEPDEIDEEGNKTYEEEELLFGFLPIRTEKTYNSDGERISLQRQLLSFLAS